MDAMTSSPPQRWLRSPLTAACSHRLVGGLAAGFAAVALALPTAGWAAAAGSPSRIPTTQQLAVLLTAHRAHHSPEAGSPATALVAARRPITGEQTTLPVTGSLTGPDGVSWLQVMLPGRPNSSTGWIAKQGTREISTRWHLVLNLVARRVSVYRQ